MQRHPPRLTTPPGRPGVPRTGPPGLCSSKASRSRLSGEAGRGGRAGCRHQGPRGSSSASAAAAHPGLQRAKSLFVCTGRQGIRQGRKRAPRGVGTPRRLFFFFPQSGLARKTHRPPTKPSLDDVMDGERSRLPSPPAPRRKRERAPPVGPRYRVFGTGRPVLFRARAKTAPGPRPPGPDGRQTGGDRNRRQNPEQKKEQKRSRK